MPQVAPHADNYLHQTIKDMQRSIVNLQSPINPLVYGQLTGSPFVNSSSYVDLGFPILATGVGMSECVQVTVSSLFELPLSASLEEGTIGVSVDGNAPTDVLAGCLDLACSNSSAVRESSSVTVVVEGLVPGLHTFQCLFASGVDGCNFVNTYLQVVPL
jgi:hypothetical protein